MNPQAPWSPTAQAFAHHQFSHVVNFWKQGRQASFRLEALPGGRAELNLTFQLPPASEVVPPPSHVPTVPAPQRPIHPLFPNGFLPKRSANTVSNTKSASQKRLSSKQRKSYRRSVLHKAALAAPSLPPPKNGTLRQAALVCVQRLQAVPNLPVNTQGSKKRPFPYSPSAPSPSNLPPLAQRIRSDIQVGESEVESPEKEILRSSPILENSLSLRSPYDRHPSCLNCGAEMTPHHQCDTTDSDSNWEDVENENDLYPTLECDSEDWAENFTNSIRAYHSISPHQ